MRIRVAAIHAAVWVLGVTLLLAGFALIGSDMAWLSALVGQAGTPHPRLIEKLRLVPLLSIVAGVELLLLAVGLKCLHRRTAQPLSDRGPTPVSLSPGMRLLFGGWIVIAVLSLDFGAISLANRLKQGLSATELVAADFGDEERVVRAVRESTPETAAILIRTQRPLQFLLNYELYPRKFYFYPERSVSVSSIPDAWLDRRRIRWILEISDTEPLHFQLIPRKTFY